MGKLILCAVIAAFLSGCAVVNKTPGKETAYSFGKGCAVLVDSSDVYSVACSEANPKDVIQAIETAKAEKQ